MKKIILQFILFSSLLLVAVGVQAQNQPALNLLNSEVVENIDVWSGHTAELMI